MNFEQMKNAGKYISDCIGLSAGFSLANPEGELLSNVTTLLNTQIPALSQSATDDIAKMLAGLVITVLSRWLFSLIEKRKEKKQPIPQVEPVKSEPKKIEINSEPNKIK